MEKKNLFRRMFFWVVFFQLFFICACSLGTKMKSVKTYKELAAVSQSPLARLYLLFKPLDIPGFKTIIYKNTKWKKSDSPIILDSNVMVIPGVTLTIEPGVEIIMHQGARLRCQGILTAKGEPDAPIIFRSPGENQYWDLIECVNATDAKTEGFGTITIEHCVIEGGRGVVVNSCNAKINSNVFKNNVSSPIRMEYSGGEITGNQIFGNTTEMESESGNGSGIMIYTDKKVVVINNDVFENISMGGRDGGGGIYGFAYDTGEITIAKNRIRKNKSDRNGGGIVGYKCLITENIIENNYAEQAGGGIFSVQCVIENNRIIENVALKGGGIYSDNCTITKNYFFKNNSPENTGGGLFYYGNGNVSLNTFLQNGEWKRFTGETIMISGGPTLTLNNIIATFGHALRIQSHSLSPDMNANDNYWGTINETEIEALVYDWLDDSKIGIVNWKHYQKSPVKGAYTLPENEFQDINVDIKTGEKHQLWGTIEKDLTIGGNKNTLFEITDNILVQDGVTLTILPGTTLNFLDDKSLRIRGRLISEGLKKKKICFTGKNGGSWESIIFENRSIGEEKNIDNELENSLLSFCLVENSKGIIMDGKGADLSYSTVRNNQNSGITIKEAKAKISNCKIYGNKSASNGGGIYIYGSKLVNVFENEIKDNVAEEDGGGVFAYGNRSNTAVNLIGNMIQGNTCMGDGGGVWASRSSIMENKIMNNQASSNGGGLYVSFALINDNRIENNQADQGGGAYAETNSSFERNTISGNRIRREFGGAAYLNFWGMSIKNEIFSRNVVEKNISNVTNGTGGICLNGAMEFENNIINNNSGIQLYNLNASTENPFEAQGCYWGTDDEKKIEGYIYDGKDDTDLSVVEYMPFVKSRKDIHIE
ncbi:MAG: right-handed parallel beta-helix repeat-containing protein [Proteobacteria bacterium]|nr:right-handed parallel beta-helix repeat-containing protein [Pseudomonadota bacterium]